MMTNDVSMFVSVINGALRVLDLMILDMEFIDFLRNVNDFYNVLLM